MDYILNYLKGINYSWWLLIGFVGQFFYFLRFVLQWYHSEKARSSVIPVIFWHLSIIAAVITLIYALQRKDPVFFVGQLAAIFIYSRNLMLIKKGKKSSNQSGLNLD